MDALWSDPRDKNGIEPNDHRGGGCYFGPNITDRVLEKNNLKLIIRSHECTLKYERNYGLIFITFIFSFL